MDGTEFRNKEIENDKRNIRKDYIETIVSQKRIDACPALINELIYTNDSELRNYIAIALSDLYYTEAVPYIMELILSSKTDGNKGTLLYALEPFDCSMYMDNLVSFLVSTSFEVRMQSYRLIILNIPLLSDNAKRELSLRINSLIQENLSNIDICDLGYDILENL